MPEKAFLTETKKLKILKFYQLIKKEDFLFLQLFKEFKFLQIRLRKFRQVQKLLKRQMKINNFKNLPIMIKEQKVFNKRVQVVVKMISIKN